MRTWSQGYEEIDLNAAVDHAIAACDGDLWVAITSLIVANKYLTHELEFAWQQVSPGYSRQKGAQEIDRS